MASEAVKLAKITRQTERERAMLDLVKSPVVLGFGAIMLNQAIYKAGWYTPDISIRVPAFNISALFGGKEEVPPERLAMNLHDSIFSFITIVSSIHALSPSLPAILGLIKK